MAQTETDQTETPAAVEAAPAGDPGAFPVFHLPVGEDGAVVLPPDLRRLLRLEAGDTLAVSVSGGSAFVTRTTRRKTAAPGDDREPRPLAGLLAGYFKDWDDINRFVQEERAGWEERLERLERRER